MREDEKRLFFGFSIEQPWPSAYPPGRVIDENSRHLTLAFLGNVPYAPLQKNLDRFPQPPFRIGPAGICDRLLFFRKVVAQHVAWCTGGEKLGSYQAALQETLSSLGYPIDPRPLLPHVTLARAPFEEKAWTKWFEPLPLIVTGIHLYESSGNLSYRSIWEIPLLPPFEEIEHTADIAFHILGETPEELYLHAAIAMGFKFPPVLRYIEKAPVESLNEAIKRLNKMITQCDLEWGCPFKAVSYHTHTTHEPQGPLAWEMIVDV